MTRSQSLTNYILVGLLVQIIFSRCQSHSNIEKGFENEYHSNGRLKAIAIARSDGATQVLSFDTIGNCTHLLTSTNNQMEGEQLWFYPNGFLEQKTNYKNGKPDGFLYQYYSSGAVKKVRILKNGYEYDLGIDYFNMHTPVVKSSLYFNDNGEIYFKQNFDSLGNLIDEEGVKPKSLQ